jgi:hypothetical protein
MTDNERQAKADAPIEIIEEREEVKSELEEAFRFVS